MVENGRNKAIDFLKKHQMDYHDIQMDEQVHIFLEEMDRGLSGANSSLQMIPTYIEVPDELPAEDFVIAIDAGGTNCRVALIAFDKEKVPTIRYLKKTTMPGIESEVSKEIFFQTLVKYVEPVVDQSEKIGFCFSFPTEIFPNKDGRLIEFCKEVKAPEVVGEVIGENLSLALKKAGYQKEKRIILFNDTVATLLAGKIFSHYRNYDSYIGFVLGTGSNSCYVENNTKILKKPDLNPDQSQIINIESGTYGRGPSGEIDRLFDQTTSNPGLYTYEKMFSGAYFGPLCLKMLQVAADDGLFSAGVSKKILQMKSIQTKDINDFMIGLSDNRISDNVLSEGNETDHATVTHLFDLLIERAALLVAINLSAVCLKTGKGFNPDSPLFISAEGSTFYKLCQLKSRVEDYLDRYLVKEKKCYYKIHQIDNATLIGAAIAGLTN
ncbi:hexokinase [bacterium]|nr:hexokinase [bacterium]RQV97065.1 MAG: hexokinase [bacterium]